VGRTNEKGRTGLPVRPFAWSAAGKCRQRSLYRLFISDNASRRELPTSLLNHETSDHLLSRCLAIVRRFRGWDFGCSRARIPKAVVLSEIWYIPQRTTSLEN
jgi:hypothetical protein